MSNISVTYTFSNLKTADANALNQNFIDIINGLKNATQDLAVINATCGTIESVFIDFPAATKTTAGVVKSGHAFIYYYASSLTWTGLTNADMSISGTPSYLGDAILEVTTTPLKIKALQKSIVRIQWSSIRGGYEHPAYIVKNNDTVMQISTWLPGGFKELFTSIFLNVNDYVTFRSQQSGPVYTDYQTYLNITAIQVG